MQARRAMRTETPGQAMKEPHPERLRTPELIRRIEAIPGVVSMLPGADRVALHVRETEIRMEDLLDALHALGARIRMFQPEAMDMETAFIKLTEGTVA